MLTAKSNHEILIENPAIEIQTIHTSKMHEKFYFISGIEFSYSLKGKPTKFGRIRAYSFTSTFSIEKNRDCSSRAVRNTVAFRSRNRKEVCTGVRYARNTWLIQSKPLPTLKSLFPKCYLFSGLTKYATVSTLNRTKEDMTSTTLILDSNSPLSVDRNNAKIKQKVNFKFMLFRIMCCSCNLIWDMLFGTHSRRSPSLFPAVYCWIGSF